MQVGAGWVHVGVEVGRAGEVSEEARGVAGGGEGDIEEVGRKMAE